jgi:hypothetical protein
MKVHRRSVLSAIGSHDRHIDREDMLVRQIVAEGDLYRVAPLHDYDAAEVFLLGHTRDAQGVAWIVSPQSGGWKIWMQIVGELVDVNRVVIGCNELAMLSYPIWHCYGNCPWPNATQDLDKLTESGAW